MSAIRGAWSWLVDEPRHLIGLRSLQMAIGAMLLFRIFTEGPFTSYFYGPHGLGRGSTKPILGAHLGGFLDVAYRTEAGVALMLLVLGVAAFALLFGYRTRLFTLVALVPFFMMERRLPEIGDGGDNVTRLVLLYLLFALPAGAKAPRGSLRVWLHNVAVIAVITQLCVVYETSGAMKVMGEKWHGGTAMYYITQVNWFGHPFFREIFKNPVATTVGTILPMLFLVSFPLAIFTRLKPVWIAFGIFFHLGIAVSMGLVSFATVMIGLELFVITDAEYESLRQQWDSFKAFVRRRRPGTGWGWRPLADPAVTLYVDGFCPTCAAAGRWIARLDVTDCVEISSFRHAHTYVQHGLDTAALERRMHAVDRRGHEVHAGFAAVRVLARRMPVLWPLYPLVSLVGRSARAEGLYDWLALRRRIVPDARVCGDGCAVGPVRAELRAQRVTP